MQWNLMEFNEVKLENLKNPVFSKMNKRPVVCRSARERKTNKKSRNIIRNGLTKDPS